MNENQIKDLLNDLDRLAHEVRDSEIKQQYGAKTKHISTVRAAQSLIVDLQSKLKTSRK